MCHLLGGSSLAEEQGSSLVAVLIVLTTTTLLFGSVAAVLTAQHRFIRRDAHRLQATYAAEAGVVAAVDRMSWDPVWRPEREEGTFPGGFEGEVSISPHGGFFWVAATARAGGQTATVRALVGAVPGPDFEAGVVLDDPAGGLVVAGSTRVRGDLWVGEGGARTAVFDGRPFTGTVEGDVRVLPAATRSLRYSTYVTALDEADRLLDLPDTGSTTGTSFHLVRSVGSLVFSAADSVLLRNPVLAIAQGDLTLSGPVRFAPGSRFVAGGRLLIRGDVDGAGGLFVGRAAIDIADTARTAGQFVSRRRIAVGRAAHLAYPSVLYVNGVVEDGHREGDITLAEGAHVDGTVVYPESRLDSETEEGRVEVAAGATVRGAVVSAGWLELNGRVGGSVLTRQFFAYASPTTYTNWLVDAVVDLAARPAPFLVPLADGQRPRFDVMLWTEERSERRAEERLE